MFNLSVWYQFIYFMSFFVYIFYLLLYLHFLSTDIQYDEDDDEITPDLWQEACWIVIRSFF